MARVGQVGDGEAGFTLLEMIVVLAIIGLALALVVPNIGQGPGRYAVASTARDIAGALRLARDRAITQDRTVQFIAEQSAFSVNGDGDLQRVPRGIALGVVGAEREEEPNGRTDTIRFFPDGSSSGGRIDVTGAAAHYSVSIEWLNGNVSIHANPAPR